MQLPCGVLDAGRPLGVADEHVVGAVDVIDHRILDTLDRGILGGGGRGRGEELPAG